MTRSVHTLEGLACAGDATVGPIHLELPTLLWPASDAEEEPTRGPVLLERPGAPSGHRYLTIRSGPCALDLDLTISAPEISGGRARTEVAAPGVVVVHGPLSAEEWARLAGAELVVLGNARAMWAEGDSFVRCVGEMRARLGAGPLLWAPRVTLPHRVPLLTYLGVDLLDATEGLLERSRGREVDESLGVEEGPRRAPADDGGTALRAEFERALDRTRRAIATGRLRELVEARLASEPVLAEMLRYADRDLGPLLEERAPVYFGDHQGRYVLAESLRRAEMRRFRRRLIERYRPPNAKEVLLLVPCSRTKPYRRSRSHRRFASAGEGLNALERVHVVSVSSPIGVVPRELEDVYPARHYDIPVTGDWSEAERDAVRHGLRHLLETGGYRSVIAHLDPAEYGFLTDVLGSTRPVVWTIGDDRTTSNVAIASLHSALVAALEGSRPVAGGPLSVVREELAEVASWQFGRAGAARLFRAPIRLAGRPWFQRLTDGHGTDLATWQEERGIFQLTVAGGERLMPDPPLAVEIDPRVPLTGDLFVPGVRGADPLIRVGDAVVVVRAGALAAVGEAMLPGPMMTQLARGTAVRLRHRVHSVTDRAMTEERRRAVDGPVV
ncbi:MAG: DUF5591 domain-containing protein [Thermoplasmata archaeon]